MWSISAYFLLALASCKNEPDIIDFKMNTKQFSSITGNEMPDPSDSTKVYRILTGDTVAFKDISSPGEKVKKRYWNLDGEEGWESTDEEFTSFEYNSPNQYKVVLCINDTLHCVAKSIVVRERMETVYNPPPLDSNPQPPTKPKKNDPPPPPPPPAPKKPELKFLLPNVYSTNHPENEFNISVRARHVAKDDLAVTVNGQDFTRFSLNKGVLSARVPLEEGKNMVKVTATNAEGSATETVEFVYSPKAPEPGPSIVFTQPSTSTATTSSDKYDLSLVTANVAKKDQLTLNVGGQNIKNFEFSSKKGELFAKVPLSLGDNKIKATATTKNGTVSQEVTVTYRPPVINPNQPGVVGIPSSSYPSSPGCIVPVRGSFSVTLLPVRDVELQSFKVYTDICGGVKVSLKGPQLSESFDAALNGNRSQINFGDVDARLKGGNSYTLTCAPIAGYGTCSSDKTPVFHDLQNCSGVNSASTPALKLDQKGNLLLFDLKFLY